ncbi:DUF2807 domain-containing protein [Fulvivirgaceae bacterium PWU4]|uniref:DUF2807 domain-containing protein n=1 Tax=Chryseosolibacter histidini TaxID=2782349 RepID=A0AAP2DGL5_9BACT|nr:DUF2807 domain-containing protein [Chryseosolibacter histidini]MBT1695930.1 DUF2807 domain-containing protein [Chryseosolibacter histidini]
MKISAIFSLALIAATAFLLIGCGDPKEFPPKALPPFNKISSNGLVTFNLVAGAENMVISTSIPESMYSAGGGQLNINGIGRMTIAVRDIKILSCNGCSVENDGPLVADTLNMYVHGGSVDLKDIQINGYLGLNAANSGTYKFSGTSNFFYVSNSNAAIVKAYGLVTDSTYVNSSAVFDTEVHATKVVNVFINSMGSVLYKGNPPIVRLTATGTGKLIRK